MAEEKRLRQVFVDEIADWPKYMDREHMMEMCHRLTLRNPVIRTTPLNIKKHFVRSGMFTYSRKTRKYRNNYDYPSYEHHGNKHWKSDKERKDRPFACK